MPRVHHVKSARKAKRERTCRNCSKKIVPGEPYKWAEPYRGPILMWCGDCTPKRSQLSMSKMGSLWDEVDVFDASECNTAEDLISKVGEVAEIARGVAEEYEEGIMAMPEPLQDTAPSAEDSRERIEALEEYANDLESWSPSSDTLEDWVSSNGDADEEEDDQRAAWLEAIREEASEAVSNFEY